MAAKWNPPKSDCIHKLNVAISQSKKSASVGISLTIRNKVGEVLAAACDRIVKKLNPLCIAACVMRKALLFFVKTPIFLKCKWNVTLQNWWIC